MTLSSGMDSSQVRYAITRILIFPAHRNVLVASSMGSLARTLSQPKTEEEHDKLTVELGVTVEGQAVL